MDCGNTRNCGAEEQWIAPRQITFFFFFLKPNHVLNRGYMVRYFFFKKKQLFCKDVEGHIKRWFVYCNSADPTLKGGLWQYKEPFDFVLRCENYKRFNYVLLSPLNKKYKRF